jgi:hypothetical protein
MALTVTELMKKLRMQGRSLRATQTYLVRYVEEDEGETLPCTVKVQNRNFSFCIGGEATKQPDFCAAQPNRSINQPTPNVSIPTAVNPNRGPIEIFVKKSRTTFKVINNPIN